MASPPPASHYPSIPNTKKRPSLSSQASGTTSKRPRLSHPLRQTSFPASDTAGYYASAGPPSARSETGSVAASVVSNTSTIAKPRGRGRPRKSTTIHADDLNGGDNVSSPVDGGGAHKTSGRGGGARSVVSAHQNDADAAGEDDEDDAADLARFQSTHDADKEADEQQIIRLDKLKSVLNSDQMSRLEKWRAIAFPKRTVQKLVNQIVSQSVTEGPINAVRVYAKWYAAEIVERAREVQQEWATAYEKTREAEKKEREEKLETLRGKLRTEDEKPEMERISEYDRRRLLMQIQRSKTDAEEYIPNPHRGGLLPDHLREALRRYKSDGEGGGVGFEGLSHPLLGTHGSKVWGLSDGSTGRRLFR